MKDTDRRIQDASRLGTTLVHQRKELSARLKDIEHVQADNEVPEDLQKKLAELEKEYNEIGKESARAFLPKSRIASDGETPTVLTSNGRESPTKMTAPSRRQRNQPSNRVHDIEFATEISTSLLAQVRQLQAALSEKDEALRSSTSAQARLEAEAHGMTQKVRHLNDSEQRYKDENWNLEMKLQELESRDKSAIDKHNRLNQTLLVTRGEKSAAQRDLDELKVSHDKLSEEHALTKRQQETDLHGLRRDVASHQTERQAMQKKIEELTAQNTELARAVSSRWNHPSAASESEFVSADEERDDGNYSPDSLDPASPVKGTPRHGMLETETIKSSLTHAHRMIQNLKNHIHREKTEKIELKRMLQDARDELESGRRDHGMSANIAKKRESQKSKKPARFGALGAARSSTTELLEDDPEWEDHEGEQTPSRSSFAPVATRADAFGHASSVYETESSDAFETATERGLNTETEAFETGQEDMAADESDELTETEGGVNRSTNRSRVVSGISTKAGDRTSFMSTASNSGDDADQMRTPVQNQQPKYRLRMGRVNSRRNGGIGDFVTDSPSNHSPASSIGTPQPPGQSLGDELDALDEGSLDGTPSRLSEDFADTPDTQRQIIVESPASSTALEESVVISEGRGLLGSRTSAGDIFGHNSDAAALVPPPASPRAEMVSSGMMTEPWEPEKVVEKQSIRERAGELVGGAVGGALAGFGIGRINRQKATDQEHEVEPGATDENVSASPDAETVTGVDSHATLPDTGIDSHAALPDHTEPQDGQTVVTDAPVDTDLPQSEIHTSDQASEEHAVPTTDAPLADKEGNPVLSVTPVSAVVLQHSEIISQHTEPILPMQSSMQAEEGHPTSNFVSDATMAVTGMAAGGVGATALALHNAHEAPQLGLSDGQSEQFRSSVLPTVLSDKAVADNLHTGQDAIPGTSAAQPGAGFFAAAPSPLVTEAEPDESRDVSENAGAAVVQPSEIITRQPLADIQHNAAQGGQSIEPEEPLPITAPLKITKPVADQGAQTTISGGELESMIRNQGRAVVPGMDAIPYSTNSPQRSIDNSGASSDSPIPPRSPRRPTSAGSIRGKAILAPPLPENHMLQIAAAQKTPGASTTGNMGPPIMPASAYRINRPWTPAERGSERAMSRDGTTPRPPRMRDSRGPGQSPSIISRRTSVSSFASELDERFNIPRSQLMYPTDLEPATDPRMIQAITQTMIGEYLWKYTRKAGRSEVSNTRHRRFFWIHPYTRTLYWSEQDPSVAGPHMLKAKSMAIQAVRVITDDNPMPPGLHRKTLVVVTPGREIMMTAQTGQRHETWFNALSYLLLRTEQEKAEAEDVINQEDLDEFDPGFSIRRSIIRFTGGDRSVGSNHRTSMSSYNSRTSSAAPNHPNVTQRQTTTGPKVISAPADSYSAVTGAAVMAATNAGSRASSAQPHSHNSGSVADRFSSITSRFRARSAHRGSLPGRRGRSGASRRGQSVGETGEVYDASVAESAEDIRAVIAKQEKDADGLENVRACCDGKILSLSRKSTTLWCKADHVLSMQVNTMLALCPRPADTPMAARVMYTIASDHASAVRTDDRLPEARARSLLVPLESLDFLASFVSGDKSVCLDCFRPDVKPLSFSPLVTSISAYARRLVLDRPQMVFLNPFIPIRMPGGHPDLSIPALC